MEITVQVHSIGHQKVSNMHDIWFWAEVVYALDKLMLLPGLLIEIKNQASL